MSYQIAKIAIASGIILTAFGPTAVADDHVQTMTIYNDSSGDGYISFDRAGGIGDKILWNSDMQTEAGDRIGTGSGHCTQLDTERNFFCSFVITLDGRGMLAGQGVQRTEPTPSTYPIIGGTGEFDGVTGVMVSMPVEDRARFKYEISIH